MTLEQNLAEAHKVIGALRLVESGHLRKARVADECRRVLEGLESWVRERGGDASPRQAEAARLARDSVARVLSACVSEGVPRPTRHRDVSQQLSTPRSLNAR